MVPIVENWAQVEGRVEGWDKSAGFITLLVERISPVEQTAGTFYPNFLERTEGTTIRVRVPDDPARRLEVSPGQRIRVRVRRGRGQEDYFAHPEHITVLAR